MDRGPELKNLRALRPQNIFCLLLLTIFVLARFHLSIKRRKGEGRRGSWKCTGVVLKKKGESAFKKDWEQSNPSPLPSSSRIILSALFVSLQRMWPTFDYPPPFFLHHLLPLPNEEKFYLRSSVTRNQCFFFLQQKVGKKCLPNHQWWYAKLKLSWNICSTHCTLTIRVFARL